MSNLFEQALTSFVGLILDPPVFAAKGFAEAVDFQGHRVSVDQRAIVQFRQLSVLRLANENQWFEQGKLRLAAERQWDFLKHTLLDANGEFYHSLGLAQKRAPERELYVQAFALFGYSHLYQILGDKEFKVRAQKLLLRLQQQRRNKHGVYLESTSSGGRISVIAHMHLLEAALAWLRIDNAQIWQDLGHEMVELCLHLFLQPNLTLLPSHLPDSKIQEPLENFRLEPGLQYEWAWLLLGFQKLTGRELTAVAKELIFKMEKQGLNAAGLVYDEIESSGIVTSSSSRLWPQCERIKALAELSSTNYFSQLQQAKQSLLSYFPHWPNPHWGDRWSSEGALEMDLVKMSSLYHLVPAFQALQQK